MKEKRYIIRDRQAGNRIEGFVTLEEAMKRLAEFEAEDKEEGIYEPDFYEIYDIETEAAEVERHAR